MVVVNRLGCCPACGIFLTQGLNPCLLQWQARSLPRSHQGSPDPSTFDLITSLLSHRPQARTMAHGYYYKGHMSIPNSFVRIYPQLSLSQPQMSLTVCLLTYYLIHTAEFAEGYHIIRKIAFSLHSLMVNKPKLNTARQRN